MIQHLYKLLDNINGTLTCSDGACVNVNGIVTFTSQPSGARVYKYSGPNDHFSGTTPFTQSLVPGTYDVYSSGVSPFWVQNSVIHKYFTVVSGSTHTVHWTFNQTRHATCSSDGGNGSFYCTVTSGPGPLDCSGVPLGGICTP